MQYINNQINGFKCPKCKSDLKIINQKYKCENCSQIYSIKDDIPDFFIKKLNSKNLIKKSLNLIDILSEIYETPFWYPLVYHLYGGINIPRINKTIDKVINMLTSYNIILDIACGTGLYTRQLAKNSNKVYGVDISMGMLQKAKKLAREQNLSNIIVARADVENLPFADHTFDGAICCGALHLFPNILESLKEVARVLIEESHFAVMTFIQRRFLKFPWITKHLEEHHGAHIFNLTELSLWLKKAGFINFKPKVYGSMLLFSARKK